MQPSQAEAWPVLTTTPRPSVWARLMTSEGLSAGNADDTCGAEGPWAKDCQTTHSSRSAIAAGNPIARGHRTLSHVNPPSPAHTTPDGPTGTPTPRPPQHANPRSTPARPLPRTLRLRRICPPMCPFETRERVQLPKRRCDAAWLQKQRPHVGTTPEWRVEG